MGLDARIYFRAKASLKELNHELWKIFREGVELSKIKAPTEVIPEGATHQVEVVTRYWSPSYQRGNFPLIASILIELVSNPIVKAVWYGNDFISPSRITEKDLLYLIEQYIYRNRL